MNRTFDNVRVLLGCLILGTIAIGGVFAQQFLGVAATYQPYPLSTVSGSASFPFVLNEEKTILINTVEYQNTVYDFDGWGFAQGTAGDTERFQLMGYSLVFIQQLRGDWMLMANGRSHLASDFAGDLSTDDFGFTVMALFQHTLNESLSLGTGVAYSLRDIPVFPIPLFMFEWKPNPVIVIQGLIPDNVTAMYRPHPTAEVGVFAKAISLNYHGDSVRYEADNAWLAYWDVSVGPMGQFHFKEWVHVTVEGGYSFLRTFAFYDDGRKQESIDLDSAAYVKVGLLIGM